MFSEVSFEVLTLESITKVKKKQKNKTKYGVSILIMKKLLNLTLRLVFILLDCLSYKYLPPLFPSEHLSELFYDSNWTCRLINTFFSILHLEGLKSLKNKLFVSLWYLSFVNELLTSSSNREYFFLFLIWNLS